MSIGNRKKRKQAQRQTKNQINEFYEFIERWNNSYIRYSQYEMRTRTN